jgi:hypothetical protein
MNERIKQLCIKAGAAPLPGSTGLFINALDPEKFAELIVKEHLNILQQEWYRLNDLPKDDLDTPRDISISVGQKSEIIRLIHLIEQHFGIESAPETSIDFPRE